MIAFTQSQRRAIDSQSKEIIVLAGAGSGKTAVMVARIARLIKHGGASTENFLVLTFTRKAAHEMRARLAVALNVSDNRLGGMLIGTFHAIALRMLQTNGDRLGYNRGNITVATPEDTTFLLDDAAIRLGYLTVSSTTGKRSYSHGLTNSAITDQLESYYNGQVDFLESSLYSVAARVIGEYHSKLLSANALDYGLILRKCQQLLQTNPDVMERYRNRIKYVMVDELQDTDLLQYNLHDLFAPPADLFAVGDMRQLLYRWRGAVPAAMADRHGGAEFINLRESFRCGDAIVSAANRLIAHNAAISGDEHTEPMVGATGGNGDFAVSYSDDITNDVLNSYDSGFAWKDMAVMARSHRVLDIVEQQLSHLGIPYRRVSSRRRDTSSPGFLLLHAALRLCINPGDGIARAIVSQTSGAVPLVPSGASTIDIALEEIIELMELDRTQSDIQQAIQYILLHCSGVSIGETLEWLATADDQDNICSDDEDSVTVLTIHAAKGLEWPCCFVAALVDGILPGGRSDHDDVVMHDERCAAYVAMTRAKERLILQASWTSMKRSSHDFQSGEKAMTSRFISDIFGHGMTTCISEKGMTLTPASETK
jgi:DNA helicase-2/ATP-dependent DNA helicase PcrA